MGLWRVWNKIRILWVFSWMIYILFYLPSSDLLVFVLHWKVASVCLGCCRVLCSGKGSLTLSLQILGPVLEGWISGWSLAEPSLLL